MLEFKKPELIDKNVVKDFFIKHCNYDCEYSFGNLFIWQSQYKTEYCFYKDYIIIRYTNEKGGHAYAFPKGEGNLEEVITLIENECDKPFFFSLNCDDVEKLRKIRGNEYIIEENRDYSDYVYNTSDLSELRGKKYQSKRNHISYFEKNNNWHYETITPDNIDDCIAMNKKWEIVNADKRKLGADAEEKAIMSAFENYEQLGFVGGMIKIDNETVAYTFGEELSEDTFCVHVEKAFSDVRGAYPIVNREFVRNELQQYKYVDREEDMGIEGLRKAKLSYHPAILPESFSAEKR